ncbi:MAG: eS6 family ribosomal protein [Candidatus Korarchaeum sp.]
MSTSRRRGIVEEFLVLDIGDPSTGRTFHLKLPRDSLRYFVGKRVGEEISGDPIGLAGYTFLITGGTDRDGFPMHPSLPTPGKKRVLLSSPPGFHPRREGERRAKLVRGSIVSDATRQINLKVLRRGEKSLEEVLGKSEAS